MPKFFLLIHHYSGKQTVLLRLFILLRRLFTCLFLCEPLFTMYQTKIPSPGLTPKCLGSSIMIGRLFVLAVDRLDLLTHQFGIVFQPLYLAVHLVNETVTLLAGDVQEAEVVLVGSNLLFELFIAAG